MAYRNINPEVALTLDKFAVAEVVQTERAARDQAQWDRMRECFHPDSLVELSWFTGTGPEFVRASRRLYDAGNRAIHQMGTTLVRVQGDRALAETGCTLLLRGTIGGSSVLVTVYTRMFARAERRNGNWRISHLRSVYQHDAITPTDPATPPVLDSERLAGYRESYRHLSYYLAEIGQRPAQDRPGVDRPEQVKALEDADAAWLSG